MTHGRRNLAGWVVAAGLFLPAWASAEVAAVEIASRRDVLGGRSFGSAGGYELLVGRLHFVVDPGNMRNRVVVDLDKAPRNAAGQVEWSADLAILKPKEAARGNGVALVDVVNRGNKTVLTGFNRAAASGDLSTEAEFGDGFLLRQGYTLVWVGWEFDVPARPGMVRIDVPTAKGVTGVVRVTFTPDAKDTDLAVRDLGTYVPRDPGTADTVMTVRDGQQGAPTTIPRNKWRLGRSTVSLDGGFEPGRTYEIAFTATDPPVAGLGFAAVRDTASWLRYAGNAPVHATHAYAFGNSQSGRFLRSFLYEGFNADEQNRQVFDAVIANVAGASRIDLNRRWATPISLGSNTATSFPFADVRLRDPRSGAEEGALENARARDHQPKIFYTNTGVEYWGGARAAALIHTTPDGAKDLTLPINERVYFLTGSQHGPARFPSTVTNGQQRDNPNNYWWTMRALLVALDRWVREQVDPPASRFPRLQDGTLVRAADVGFPNLAKVQSPRTLSGGARAANHLIAQNGAPGAALPHLVPQVDASGNERAGIRLPEIAVPLATYTGWNFRKSAIGAPDQLYPLLGSYIPFAATRAEREQAHDPRQSIEERYSGRDQYLSLIKEAGAALVKERYLLADDLPALVEHAGEHFNQVTAKAP